MMCPQAAGWAQGLRRGGAGGPGPTLGTAARQPSQGQQTVGDAVARTGKVRGSTDRPQKVTHGEAVGKSPATITAGQGCGLCPLLRGPVFTGIHSTCAGLLPCFIHCGTDRTSGEAPPVSASALGLSRSRHPVPAPAPGSFWP